MSLTYQPTIQSEKRHTVKGDISMLLFSSGNHLGSTDEKISHKQRTVNIEVAEKVKVKLYAPKYQNSIENNCIQPSSS
jgi:hypothetical protein